MKIDPITQKAFDAASLARANAYCPYSKFQVGAAFVLKGTGQIFAGCNVENASFGATICAERTAIFSAVAQLGTPQLEQLVLVADKDPLAVPCGPCLQVIAEFCAPDFPIFLANPMGVQERVILKDLMPRAFAL